MQNAKSATNPPAPRVDIQFDAERYRQDGFSGPTPFLSQAQVSLLLNHRQRGKLNVREPWRKALCAADPLIFEIASEPRLLAALRVLLGEDVFLWGASFPTREVGRWHNWHVDVESQDANYRFASLWVGLENTSAESALKFIAGSHAFKEPLLKLAGEQGIKWDELDDDRVMTLARSQDSASTIVQPTMTNGEAILFHGRAWHGSHNTRGAGARTALLLQFAAADAPVRIPEDYHVWPIRFKSAPRPPVVAVTGQGNARMNDVFDRPVAARATETAVTTVSHQPDWPLQQDLEKGFASEHYFRGLTGLHRRLTCHASVLSPGATPHPPHAHVEEEILIVLEGEGTLRVAEDMATDEVVPRAVKAGAVAYYPAYWFHTLTSTSSAPLFYLMFKWQGRPIDMDQVLPALVLDSTQIKPEPVKPYRNLPLFEGPTQFLNTLHMHVTDIDPQGGYDPHVDPYDVAIIVLEGQIETGGRRLTRGGVAYFAAGESHGLRGIGPGVSRYLVVEFRGPDAEKPPIGAKGHRPFKPKAKTKTRRRPKRTRWQKYRDSIAKRLPGFPKRGF